MIHQEIQNEATVSNGAAAPAARETCPNCDAERVGEYCQGCGQHYLRRRLTLRILWREFTERFFKLERGLLRTMREMTTDPGGMISRYVSGKRRSYLNPFSYVVIGSVLTVLMFQLTGVNQELAEIVRTQLYEQTSAQGTAANPAFIQLYIDFMEMISRYSLYTTLAMALPFALLLRLWFYRSRYNIAEHFVFVLFCFGHVALFSATLYLLRWVFNIPIGVQAVSVVSLLLYVALCSFAAFKFYGERLAAVLKIAGSFAVSYAVVMIVIFAGFFVYSILWTTVFTGGSGWTLLEAAEQNALPIAQQLLEEGTEADETIARTPLLAATENGNIAMATLLLDHGANVNTDAYQGRTPILIATENEDAEMVALLLERGANVSTVDQEGRSPLHIAIHADQPDIARMLLAGNPDPNVIKKNGNTQLLEAINHGYPDIARWLIEHGADVDVMRDDDRATALMAAAYEDDLASTQLLLEYGADPTLTNPDGETALDMADDEQIVALLRKALAEKSTQQ